MSRQRGISHLPNSDLAENTMNSGEKPHRYPSLPEQLIRMIVSLILLSGMLLSVVLLFIIQLFLLPLYPFYPRLMMDACSICAASAWSWMNRTYCQVGNGRIVITGDEDIPEGESALVISNHVSFVDFFPINILAEHKKMLAFARYFAKVNSNFCAHSLLEVRNICSIFWMGNVFEWNANVGKELGKRQGKDSCRV